MCYGSPRSIVAYHFWCTVLYLAGTKEVVNPCLGWTRTIPIVWGWNFIDLEAHWRAKLKWMNEFSVNLKGSFKLWLNFTLFEYWFGIPLPFTISNATSLTLQSAVSSIFSSNYFFYYEIMILGIDGHCGWPKTTENKIRNSSMRWCQLVSNYQSQRPMRRKLVHHVSVITQTVLMKSWLWLIYFPKCFRNGNYIMQCFIYLF